MTRLAYDMSVRGGRCQLTALVPLNGVFESASIFCDTPTRGLTVYIPLSAEELSALRVSVCPKHLHDLWEKFGLPLGEPVWQANPNAHKGD
jgi:hypothetical protein